MSGKRAKRGGVKKGARKGDKGSKTNEENAIYSDTNSENENCDDVILRELWQSQFGTSTIFSN